MRCVICDAMLPKVHRKDICQTCDLEIRLTVAGYYTDTQEDATVVNLIERIKSKCPPSED